MPVVENPRITKFAEKYGISRTAAGMAIFMLKNDSLKLDESVYHPDLPVNTLWRTEHLLGILRTCERVGLL